jgi:hypothetical protein
VRFGGPELSESYGNLSTTPAKAHNLRVSDLNQDPPKTLREAEQNFRSFLLREHYPETICWLIPGDVVISIGPHYWVRKRGTEAEQYAAARYSEGIDRGLGIHLRAICATKAETFASVFIPKDSVDAQYHFLGPLLKVSCPVERHSATAITDPLRWLWLRWRYGKQSNVLEVNQRGEV